MSTVYTTAYTTLVRDQLQDVSGGTEVWGSDEIADHVLHAIKEVSQVRPYLQSTVLSVADERRTVDISSLSDRVWIDRVEFYVDQDVKLWRKWTEFADELTLDINFNADASDTLLTGTVTFAASTAVTGSGTAFTTEAPAGSYIKHSDDTPWYEVLSVASDTALTLRKTYGGTTGADTVSTTPMRTNKQVARVFWGGMHTVGASASTLPTELEQLIVDGACTYALRAYASEGREAIADAISIIDTGNTAIDSVTAKVTAAAERLAAGSAFIGYKLSEANTAITNAGSALARVLTDLASGRTAVGTELTNADNVLDGIGASLAIVEADIVAARSHMDTSGSEANTALDLMAALATDGAAYLTSGASLINAVNVGATVPALYSQYANSKFAQANAKYQEAMGFLAEDQPSREFLSAASVGVGATNSKIALARAYLAEDMVVGEYSGLAGGEVQLAANFLNQARLDLAQDAVAVEHRQYATAELNNGAMLMRQGQSYYSECIHELRVSDSVLKHSLAVADRREIVFRDGLKRAQGRQKRTRRNDLLPITV